MPDHQRPTVSIIIKAFNEESHIAGAIQSALAALAGIGGEVILADGASSDRTIAIAENIRLRSSGSTSLPIDLAGRVRSSASSTAAVNSSA